VRELKGAATRPLLFKRREVIRRSRHGRRAETTMQANALQCGCGVGESSCAVNGVVYVHRRFRSTNTPRHPALRRQRRASTVKCVIEAPAAGSVCAQAARGESCVCSAILAPKLHTRRSSTLVGVVGISDARSCCRGAASPKVLPSLLSQSLRCLIHAAMLITHSKRLQNSITVNIYSKRLWRERISLSPVATCFASGSAAGGACRKVILHE
jgi:hypothetical protein